MKEYMLFLILLPSYFSKADIYVDTAFFDELNPLPDNCIKVLNTFAESASDLSKCYILYARPIKLCERCVDQYIHFVQDYNELMNSKYDNGSLCHSLLISRDRLDAVLHSHDSIVAIWDQGHCNSCFNLSTADNNTEPSENTKHFNKLYQDTMVCIRNNSKVMNSSEEVCNKCMQLYINLDEYYKSLSHDGIGLDSICMDTVDSMNVTRFLWSNKLNCCHLRKSPEIVFLCCTGIISALPILFYLAVRFCGPMRDLPKVLRQSRFSQKFLRSQR